MPGIRVLCRSIGYYGCVIRESVMAIRRFRRKKLKLNREDMRKRLKKRTFVFSIGFLLCLLFLFSLEMMTSYERQLENERYKAGLDARIYSEILIKDLMVSQNASDTLDYIARDHEGGYS